MESEIRPTENMLKELQLAIHGDSGSQKWPVVRIILVSGFPGTKSTRLRDSHWAWLAQIAKDALVQTQCFEFQNNLPSKGASVWQVLNDDGDTLLAQLLELETKTATQIPVVLIGHGLGGFLVKKALTRLSERYFDPAIRPLEEVLACVVLLGCPHPTIDKKEHWPLLDHLLKYDHKLDSKVVKSAAKEVAIAANLCSKFQECGIHCQIITTFESQPTTIRRPPNIFKAEKHILVSHDFAMTCVRNEKMIQLDLDGRDIRTLDKDQVGSKEFKECLISTLKEASRKLPSKRGELSPRDFGDNLFASTATETTPSVAHLPVPASNNATLGKTTRRSHSDTTTIAGDGPENERVPRLPCRVFGRHPRNPNFFGRADILKELDQYLLPAAPLSGIHAANMLQSFAVCGMGGMGKTQIALEYAYSRQSSFDAVFWITANTKTSIAQCFSTVAISLGVATEAEVTDLTVSFSIVLRWLSNPKKLGMTPSGEETSEDATWLLIFDNADAIELMSDFWPSTGRGSVLLTTRDPAGQDFCLGKGIMLPPLSSTDSLELFKTQLNRTEESMESVGTDFVEKFGGLPLAIVQVASLIRRRQMTVDEFSHTYQDGIQHSGLEDFQATQFDGGYRQSIFTVFALESLDKMTKSLFNVIAMFDPFHIQEFILTQEHPSLSNCYYPSTKGDYLKCRSNLLKASLITRALSTEHVELHPLVQEVAQASMSVEARLLHFSVAVSLVHASRPSQTVKWGHEKQHREQSGQLLAHALKLRTIYEKHFMDIPLDDNTTDHWIEVLIEGGWYLYERGDHESSLPFLTLAFRIAQKQTRETPELLADVLMCLSVVGAQSTGPEDVVSYAAQHLEVRQQVCDSYAGRGIVPIQVQHDHTMAVATLAMAYIYADEFEKAIPFALESLEAYRSYDKFRDWRTVPYFAIGHTGWAYWSLGQYDEAERIIMEGVNADRRNGIGSAYGFAHILIILGNVLEAQGRLTEAAAVHEECLTMYYSAVGDTVRTAQARLKHAEHLTRARRNKEAWFHYQRTMETFARNRFYKPELARTQVKAGRFLLSVGEASQGRALLGKAQDTFGELSIEANVNEVDDKFLDKMVLIHSR